jgi:hypothetical protein
MGTPCIIGYQDPDTKQFHTIRCNYDGYLDSAGQTLLKHYQDFNKIKELVALGDISELEEKVTPDPGIPHSYDSPAKNVTVAYHRDRGEDKEETATVIADKWDKDDREHYNYCYQNGQWHYATKRIPWIPLKDAKED